MARRTPFPFANYIVESEFSSAFEEKVRAWITQYEDALLVEYKSGDIDVASYHEGLRMAYEDVLIDVLGVPQEDLAEYLGPQRPQALPYADELPLLSDPDNWLITYEQVEQWSGKRLTREQWDTLNGAIPNSSVIPDAITTIVNQITR